RDREALDLPRLEPDADAAVDEADRGRDGPGDSDTPLGLRRDLRADSAREAVRDQGRLEGDHGTARFEGRAHFRVDAEEVGHCGKAPMVATQRAAASSPSSGPPRRNPAARASPAPVVSTTSAGRASNEMPPTTMPSAPRFTTSVSVSISPTSSASSALAKTTCGRIRASSARNSSTPAASIAAVEERSTLTRGATAAAASDVSRIGGRARLYPA